MFNTLLTGGSVGRDRNITGWLPRRLSVWQAFGPAPVWHVDRVHLIRSHLEPGGARYEHLLTFPN